jgi:hypothetical protein
MSSAASLVLALGVSAILSARSALAQFSSQCSVAASSVLSECCAPSTKQQARGRGGVVGKARSDASEVLWTSLTPHATRGGAGAAGCASRSVVCAHTSYTSYQLPARALRSASKAAEGELPGPGVNGNLQLPLTAGQRQLAVAAGRWSTAAAITVDRAGQR